MNTDSSIPPRPADWSDEYRLEELLARPEVRSMVTASAQNAHAGMSGEEFIMRSAAAISSVRPELGKALLRGAARGREHGLRRGYKTGKTDSAEFTAPIGHVIAAVLCSLARNSQAITGTRQLEDGCVLTADIPSDAKTFGGILTIEIGPTPTGTAILGTATIPGQLYDWGKSKKVLTTLIADIPVLLPA
jgi:hypothetical protein